MRANILILIFTILLGVGVTLWLDDLSRSVSKDSKLQRMPVVQNSAIESVPEFEFIDINGQKHHIRDYKGKVMLIHFWATWCTPCVIEFPKIIQLASDRPEIVVIALSSDISDEKILRFLEKNPERPSRFIVARDVKREITEGLFQTFKLPETFIISPSGLIVKKMVGDIDWDSKEIDNLLSSLKK